MSAVGANRMENDTDIFFQLFLDLQKIIRVDFFSRFRSEINSMDGVCLFEQIYEP